MAYWFTRIATRIAAENEDTYDTNQTRKPYKKAVLYLYLPTLFKDNFMNYSSFTISLIFVK